MDLVTRMLNAMSNYDSTLKHFSDIREKVLTRTSPPGDVVVYINRACYEYLADSAEQALPEDEDTQTEIIDSLPNAEDMGDRLHYLGIPPDENLAYGIVLWAAAMSASRFSMTPWNHLYDLIREESAGMPKGQDEANETGSA